MAKQETEVVLDLSVDQGSMLNELERTKKAIIGLKEEADDLKNAYKSGKITQEEYAKELVRVEALLKTTQSAYTNTQKAVTGVKTKMDDLIASNNKLAQSVKTSTENIRIGGTTVGELTTKVTGLLNPVTAAVGVVGALGAAYARSTIGAKDLDFASNQLAAATTLLTNEFAKLFSSAEDGEGVLSKLTNNLLEAFSPALAASSKAIALAQEGIEDAQRNEIILRQQTNARLEENQELMTKIQDSQVDINEKTHAVTQILSNLRTNEEEILKVKNEQLKALQTQLDGSKNDEKLQDLVAIKVAEISAFKRDTERKVQSILKLESNVLDAENKKVAALQKQNSEKAKAEAFAQSEIEREKRIRDLDKTLEPTADPFGTKDFKDQTIQLDDKRVEVFKENTKKQNAEYKKRAKDLKAYNEEQLALTEENFNSLAGLFSQGSDARRIFALGAIGADTAQAIASLTAASEANPANAFTFGGAGIAQYAAGIIRILANIVAAKQFLGGSFAGGADFVTSKPTMIMVGDNPGGRERVTVEPLSGRGKSTYNPRAGIAAFAGGGSMTFDGMASNATRSINETLAAANAVKRMPTPEVSVKEITKKQNRITVKETISRA